MKFSLKTLIAVGALALAATQANASTVNLSTVGSTDTVFDTLPGWMEINVSGGVTGAIFKMADTINDGYTVNYQLYEDDQTTVVGANWTFTDIGEQAQNLAMAGVYRAMSAGQYFLRLTFVNGDATAFGASTQVSAVPLPGAALLFGSALLGMAGLRRKQAAAKEMAAV